MIRGSLFSYRIMAAERRYRGAKIDEERLHLRLLDRGGLPADALEAPLASWILARLTAEAGMGGSYADAGQSNDGGAYSLFFEVSANHGAVVAGFELLGYTWAVEMVGRSQGSEPAQVVDDFIDLLLRRPEQVSRCRMAVYDSEWSEFPCEYMPYPPSSTDRNIYGWDGGRYLGRGNFWCAAEVGRPWPGEAYSQFYESILADYRLQADEPPEDALEDTDAEALSTLVSQTREQLRAWLGTETGNVAWVAYDLDGEVVSDEVLSPSSALDRLETCVLEGLDVAWQKQGQQSVIKVWEYPASEPPWSVVFERRAYRPEVRP